MTEQTQEHRLQQSNFISSNSQGKGMKLINPSGEGVFRSRTLLFRDKRWFKIRSEGRIRCCSLFCSLNSKPTIRKWNSWNHLGKPFKTIPNHYLKNNNKIRQFYDVMTIWVRLITSGLKLLLCLSFPVLTVSVTKGLNHQLRLSSHGLYCFIKTSVDFFLCSGFNYSTARRLKY